MSVPSSPNALVYTMTLDDTLAAYRLTRWSLGRAVPFLLVFILALIVVAIGLYLVLGGVLQPRRELYTVVLFGVAFAFVGGFAPVLLSRYVLLPRQVRRIYKQQAILREECTVWWDEAALHCRTATVVSDTPWTYYRKRREDGRTLLLYHSDLIFQILPKRVFSPEQAAAIRPLVDRIPTRDRG